MVINKLKVGNLKAAPTVNITPAISALLIPDEEKIKEENEEDEDENDSLTEDLQTSF